MNENWDDGKVNEAKNYTTRSRRENKKVEVTYNDNDRDDSRESKMRVNVEFNKKKE